ncbi:MAG TPA: acyl-CoA dehydrogenase family protein, partial [Acetobacteraceae bacterium]|nr:acyl-CoA dehydrogenase family protein [Acetobacteraceae bacterium]
MNLDLTEEQRLLGETVDRFIADRYDFHAREKYLREPQGFSRAVWADLAELGLLTLPFAEEDGGFGAGGVETMLVMEAFGRGLVAEPYLSTVILCGTALRLAATPAQKQARLPGLIAGTHFMALAHGERAAPRNTLADIRASALADGESWLLNGEKSAVLHGDSADELIVSAITPDGVTLFLVPGTAEGVTRHGRATYDGRRIADITLDDVRVNAANILGTRGDAAAILRTVFETATAAVAAEAVGAMAMTLDATTDYLKTRRQFGVAIGSFQALQHRAVDMLIQVELARSMALLAAVSLDMPDAAARARNIAAAKVQIGRSGRCVG